MSSVYATEPPPKGRVVLSTSFGELEVELFARECPKACRNFVQLCLDGYYDGVGFHRLIPGLMLQGGDPTGTGQGGDSAVNNCTPFANETHSRLRFTRRGLLGCAGGGGGDGPHGNNSQFFITYGAAPHLDGKHTLFGRLAGDTIYNFVGTEDVEADDSDRPLKELKVTGVSVPENPFEDGADAVVAQPGRWPHQRAVIEAERRSKEAAAKPRPAAKKQLNLLSFGDDAEEDEDELDAMGATGIKSSHDVLEDKALLKGDAVPQQQEQQPEQERGPQPAPADQVKPPVAGEAAAASAPAPPAPEVDEGALDDDAWNRRMMEKMLAKRAKFGKGAAAGGGAVDQADATAGAAQQDQPMHDTDAAQQARVEEAQHPPPVPPTAPREPIITSIAGVKIRGGALKLKKGAGGVRKQRRDEAATLERMKRFKQALVKEGGGGNKAAGAGGSADDAPEDTGWMMHKLHEEKTANVQDFLARNNPDDYVVVDPLLEKGKAKYMKAEKKRGGGERSYDRYAGGTQRRS